MQKRGRGKEVQPPEEPKPPRTTHKSVKQMTLNLPGHYFIGNKFAKLLCHKWGISSAAILN